MRATPAMMAAERKKTEARRKRVEEINQILGMRNSLVILKMYGACVHLFHGYVKPKDGDDDHLVIEILSDVEFDSMDLADSSAIVERCLAMTRAIRVVEPYFRNDAVEGMRYRLKALMGIAQ